MSRSLCRHQSWYGARPALQGAPSRVPEFLALFFPALAARLDVSRARFLDRELFAKAPDGDVREPDVGARVPNRSSPAEEMLVTFAAQCRGAGHAAGGGICCQGTARRRTGCSDGHNERHGAAGVAGGNAAIDCSKRRRRCQEVSKYREVVRHPSATEERPRPSIPVTSADLRLTSRSEAIQRAGDSADASSARLRDAFSARSRRWDRSRASSVSPAPRRA